MIKNNTITYFFKTGQCDNLENQYRFYQAVQNKNLVETQRLLLSKAANINERFCGQTALHYAALNNDIDMVKILINNGAELDNQDCRGNTALHLAVQMQYQQIVEILLESSASKSIENDLFLKPIDLALKNKNKKIKHQLMNTKFKL
jgi:ankyrin repeat protein